MNTNPKTPPKARNNSLLPPASNTREAYRNATKATGRWLVIYLIPIRDEVPIAYRNLKPFGTLRQRNQNVWVSVHSKSPGLWPIKRRRHE